MSEQDKDDFSKALDDFLAKDMQEDEGEVEKDNANPLPQSLLSGMEVFFQEAKSFIENTLSELEKQEAEAEVDKETEIIEKVQPILVEIIDLCEKNKLPCQVTLIAAKDKAMTVFSNPELSIQVQGALVIYKLPHSITHLVHNSAEVKNLPMVDEPHLTQDEDTCDLIQLKINKVVRICKEIKVPIQYGFVINRTEGKQETWAGMSAHGRPSCFMQAAVNLYQSGSSLSADVVSIANDLVDFLTPPNKYGDL